MSTFEYEINMPVFVAAFNIAYANNKDSLSTYDELMTSLKKETNLVYHMMIEALVYIKK